ncbi:MAG: hypothetical protein ACRBBZ_00580 [Nitrosopumilus sp.]
MTGASSGIGKGIAKRFVEEEQKCSSCKKFRVNRSH